MLSDPPKPAPATTTTGPTSTDPTTTGATAAVTAVARPGGPGVDA
ncbi:hypothetical protein [Streptomyces sp. URMC 129]